MNKKTIFILLSSIVIGAAAGGFLYYRNTIFSKQILRLEILSSDSAKMGEEVEYTIKYKNNGDFALEQPKLIFELPDHSLREDGKTRFNQNLEDIYPGDENIIKFSARLLGKDGELKTARAWLSYKPRNLSVRYESTTTFTTKIEMSPMTLTFDLPSKAEKGKEITYSINYFSNVNYPLENLSLRVETPSGFNFESSDPLSLDHQEWKLNTLNKAQGGRIKIKGKILSDTGRQLNFSAKLGIWRSGTFVVIKEASQDVEIISPLLFITQQVNNSSNYVASAGEDLNYEISLRNIGESPFDNLFVIARLDSPAFNLSTLKSKSGQVKLNDNLIVFDSKQISDLKSLKPRQEIKVEFSVKLKDSWNFSEGEKNNMFLRNKVNVLDVSEEFSNKINSKLEFWQKAYYSSQEGIDNSGPLPPEVGKTTTYTLVWQIKNQFNNVRKVKVKAFLPLGVSLTSKISPESQVPNFSLDSASREVVWSLAELAPGQEAKIAFQVSLTPNVIQKGKIAELVGQVTFSGEDQFTGSITQGDFPAADTSLPDDAQNSGKGIVQ